MYAAMNCMNNGMIKFLLSRTMHFLFSSIGIILSFLIIFLSNICVVVIFFIVLSPLSIKSNSTKQFSEFQICRLQNFHLLQKGKVVGKDSWNCLPLLALIAKKKMTENKNSKEKWNLINFNSRFQTTDFLHQHFCFDIYHTKKDEALTSLEQFHEFWTRGTFFHLVVCKSTDERVKKWTKWRNEPKAENCKYIT